jgi:virginiamycin A acetyltransferase
MICLNDKGFKMYNKLKKIILMLIPASLHSKFRYKEFLKKGCTIGENVEILSSNVEPNSRYAYHASVRFCDIGEYTSIGRYSKINNAILGKYCSISWDVTIGATNHPTDNISTHAFPYVKRIGFVEQDNQRIIKTQIGNDVWVGCNAVILPGVIVGDGAIIAAGSVVTKDVPDYAIVAGVPAKVVKFRFDEKTIISLKELKWWNLPPNIIKSNIDLFQKRVDESSIERLRIISGITRNIPSDIIHKESI